MMAFKSRKTEESSYSKPFGKTDDKGKEDKKSKGKVPVKGKAVKMSKKKKGCK